MAIARNQVTATTGGSGAYTAFASAVAQGQCIIVWGWSNSAWTPAWSDTNGNVYSVLAQYSFNGGIAAVAMAVTNSVTTAPTLTAGNSPSSFGGSAAYYNGFVHVPTYITADTNHNTGTGTTISIAGFNCSLQNELLWAFEQNTAQPYPNPSSGVFAGASYQSSFSGHASAYDSVNNSSGTAVTFPATITSDTWQVAVFGFADQGILMGQACL